MPVPELLPLSAYETGRPWTIPRMAVFAALWFFVFMTIAQVVMTRDTLGVILIMSAIAAILFGPAFGIELRCLTRRTVRQLHDDTSPWVSPAPPGQHDARLACSVMRGVIAVGPSRRAHLLDGARTLQVAYYHTRQ